MPRQSGWDPFCTLELSRVLEKDTHARPDHRPIKPECQGAEVGGGGAAASVILRASQVAVISARFENHCLSRACGPGPVLTEAKTTANTLVHR